VTFFCISKRKSPKKKSPEKTTAPVFRRLREGRFPLQKTGAVRTFSGLPPHCRIQLAAMIILKGIFQCQSLYIGLMVSGTTESKLWKSYILITPGTSRGISDPTANQLRRSVTYISIAA